jgi:hypothetical protein
MAFFRNILIYLYIYIRINLIKTNRSKNIIKLMTDIA